MTNQQNSSPEKHLSLAHHCLNVAAGTAVNFDVFEEHARLDPSLNLARLHKLGQAFQQGWLHNVLRRITPFTARNNQSDYLLMADLFITSPSQAVKLLHQLSKDLSAFAIAAGAQPSTTSQTPSVLKKHVELYTALATQLSTTHSITAPAPFATTTLDARTQAELPFIRSFLAKQAA